MTGGKKYNRKRLLQNQLGRLKVNSSNMARSGRTKPYSLAIERELEIPAGSTATKLHFDFLTRHVPDDNIIRVVIPGHVDRTVFDGADSNYRRVFGRSKGHDSGWHSVIIPLTNITGSIKVIISLAENHTSSENHQEFYMRNFYLLYEAIP